MVPVTWRESGPLPPDAEGEGHAKEVGLGRRSLAGGSEVSQLTVIGFHRGSAVRPSGVLISDSRSDGDWSLVAKADVTMCRTQFWVMLQT